MNFVQSKQIAKYIKKYQMQFFLMLGMRSNGKSCATKSYTLRQAYLFNEQIFYLRRYANDCQVYKIESYFTSVDGFSISDITDGEFTHIKAKQGKLYFANEKIDKNGKSVLIPIRECGYYGSLSESEHFKSLNFPNAKFIIFEEFVTDKIYLNDEFNLLFNLISTVFRNNKGIVFLIGNTISEINPYFRNFELTEISSQKINSIDIYLRDETKIAVWLTAPLNIDNLESRKMSFGERSRMIKKGEWDIKRKRKLEKPKKDYNVLYKMVFRFDNKLFLMELLENENCHIWFVSPKTTEIQKNTRIISDILIESDFVTIGFIPINNNEVRAFNLLKQGKIAYSDNLTGTQFIQCYEQMNKGIS